MIGAPADRALTLPTPAPVAAVTVLKLANKSYVYVCGYGTPDATPLFFDPDGRGELYPTLYACWRFADADRRGARPLLLPPLPTHSEVSPKVLGGADLMLPGLKLPAAGLDALGEWDAGSKRVVVIPENPYAFAVGRMEVSSEDAAGSGLKGKGIKTMHYFGDLLWEMGDKSRPHESFTIERVFPIDAVAPEAEAEAEAEADAGAGPGAGAGPEGGGAADEARGGEAAEAGPGASQEEEAAPAADLDGRDLCEVVFVRALAALPDADLPVMVSNFWSKSVLPMRPEGTTLDIKQSPFKKISKLVSALQKKKVLKCKLVRKEEHIVAVDRAHPDIARAQAGAATAAAAEGAGGGARKGAGGGGAATIEVDTLFKPTSNLRPIFAGSAATGEGRDAMYSAEQVRAALGAYCTREELFTTEGSERELKLDQQLASQLYGKKEPQAAGDTEAEDRLLERLMGKLTVHSRVVRTFGAQREESLRKGRLEPILVTAEDRHKGRKFTTKVTGLEAFGIVPNSLASDLKSKLSMGASVGKDLAKSKHDDSMEVALQGNVINEVVDFLRKEYGVPTKHIKTQSRCK